MKSSSSSLLCPALLKPKKGVPPALSLPQSQVYLHVPFLTSLITKHVILQGYDDFLTDLVLGRHSVCECSSVQMQMTGKLSIWIYQQRQKLLTSVPMFWFGRRMLLQWDIWINHHLVINRTCFSQRSGRRDHSLFTISYAHIYNQFKSCVLNI